MMKFGKIPQNELILEMKIEGDKLIIKKKFA